MEQVMLAAMIPADLWELVRFTQEVKVYCLAVNAELDLCDRTEVGLIPHADVDWQSVRRLLAAAHARGVEGKPLYSGGQG